MPSGGACTTTPGYLIADGEQTTNAKLRMIATPIVQLNANSVGSREFGPTVYFGVASYAAESTTSASGVMMGYGGVAQLTPTGSGIVVVTFSGWCTGTVTNAVAACGMHVGTGTAPSNGNAPVGTAFGPQSAATIAAANTSVPVCLTGLAGGLTTGITYWFDLTMANTGVAGTVTLNQVFVTGYELR